MMDGAGRSGLQKLVLLYAESMAQVVKGVENCVEDAGRMKSMSTTDALRTCWNHSSDLSEKLLIASSRSNRLLLLGSDSSASDKHHQDEEQQIKKAHKYVRRMKEDMCGVTNESASRLQETRVGQIIKDSYHTHTQTNKKEPLFSCKCCSGLREDEPIADIISDPNLEIVGPAEKIVADDLRGCCTSYGEEKLEYLSKSAGALLRLGQLYLHKAACSTAGTLEKLSFIRCFALLHAARVRIELNPSEESEHQVSAMYHSMSKALLEACDSNQKEPRKLVQAAWDIVHEVKEMRLEMKDDLKILDKKREKQSTSFLDTAELNKAQNGRINDVKALNENMTLNYLSIMQNIGEKCVLILGKPPTKFAVAGLGSLARKETTLFSDFEHVILLEDADHSEKVYEYFRWFTVLFQVIVIGLGETIVPAVCVKSINNLYSNEPSKDCWFFDVYTRCGIAFDGMAPQACATPLGRQLFTGDCNQVKELIKPIKEMLLYLDPKEDLRHGYNLKDLLSCSCYVFGDKAVYDNFQVRHVLISRCENPHTVVLRNTERIIQNPNQHIRDGFFDVRGLAKFNAKAAYYRPFVMLIGSIGRLHKIEAIKTFKILDGLKVKGAINSILHHKLSFAFAVICEMRARAYTKAQSQRRVFNLEDIREMIGGEAEWACKDMMQYLQDSVPKHEKAAVCGTGMVELQQFNEQYVIDSPRNQIRDLYFCGQYEIAVEIGQEYYSRCEDWTSQENAIFEYWLFKNYYQAGRAEEKRDYWEALEQIYWRLTKWPGTFEREKAECICIMAEVYEVQQRFCDAYETTKNWLLFYLKAGTEQPIHCHKLPEIYKKYIVAASELMKPGDEEVHHLLMKLLSNERPECQYTLKCIRAVISIIADKSQGTFSQLSEVAEEIRTKARNIVEPRMMLKMIWALQVNDQRWSDAVRTAEYIYEFPDIPCTETEQHAMKDKKWLETLATCAAGELVDVLATIYKNVKKTIEDLSTGI